MALYNKRTRAVFGRFEEVNEQQQFLQSSILQSFNHPGTKVPKNVYYCAGFGKPAWQVLLRMGLTGIDSLCNLGVSMQGVGCSAL